MTTECDKCRREREERERKQGAYWLSAEGRAEIRETWDTDPKAIPPSLLDEVERLEAEVAALRAAPRDGLRERIELLAARFDSDRDEWIRVAGEALTAHTRDERLARSNECRDHAKALRAALRASPAPLAATAPVCNVENAVGHHCRLAEGHEGPHTDKHGSVWPPSPASSPSRGEATPWEVRPGTYEVRISCPRHAFAPMRRYGEIARCSECGDAVAVCDDIRGWKHCVREKGHGGIHVSPSGSSWTAPSPREAPETNSDPDGILP